MPHQIKRYTVEGTGGQAHAPREVGGSGVTETRIVIYDVLGREVATVVTC